MLILYVYCSLTSSKKLEKSNEIESLIFTWENGITERWTDRAEFTGTSQSWSANKYQSSGSQFFMEYNQDQMPLTNQSRS